VTVTETVMVAETVTVAETAGAKAAAAEAMIAEAAVKPAAENRVPDGDLLGLLRYLVDLAGNLPEPALGDFMRSDARAEMKRLIGDLENSRG
jgi:hypothetical protein